MDDLKACSIAFDRWYAEQRHQLSNEQVCRVIWTASWNAAARPPAQPAQVDDSAVASFVERAASVVCGKPFPTGSALAKAREISDLALSMFTTAEPVAQGEKYSPLSILDSAPDSYAQAYIRDWCPDHVKAYIARLATPPAQPPEPVADVRAMVNRFLGWQLPKDFAPDCGISFKHAPDALGYSPTWPIGTNLFTAEQAEQMFRYALTTTPSPVETKTCNRNCDCVGPCKMGDAS